MHQPLDAVALHARFNAEGVRTVGVHSAARDRGQYLQRPDLGSRLSGASRTDREHSQEGSSEIVFVLAHGLSSLAVSRQALPLLQALRPSLADWTIGPIAVAYQAHVALGDEIGAMLGAQSVVVLIGERPGLSAPDSLGIYLTYRPEVGYSDAQRNCISNVRPEGLDFPAAAHKLHYLLTYVSRLRLTDVERKGSSDMALAAPGYLTSATTRPFISSKPAIAAGASLNDPSGREARHVD